MRKIISAFLAVNNLYMGLTIVGSFVATSVTLAAFAQVCEVKEAGPLRSLTFPSGVKIALSGHTHGITAEVMNLARLIDDTKNSNEVYLLNGIQTLGSLKNTLVQYRENVATIKEKVRSGDLNYIALEYGDQTMRLMTEYSQEFLPMTRENLKTRGLKEAQFIDDAFLVFAGPALYLANKEPDLMKNVKIVPVEDDDLMQRSLDAQSQGATERQSFFEKFKATDDLKDLLNTLCARIILDYDLHKFLEDDWAFDELKSKVPTAVFKDAKVPIESALVAAEFLRKRDAQSSLKILAQEGSGILFIGSAHSRSLSNIFRNACLTKGK